MQVYRYIQQYSYHMVGDEVPVQQQYSTEYPGIYKRIYQVPVYSSTVEYPGVPGVLCDMSDYDIAVLIIVEGSQPARRGCRKGRLSGAT